MIKLYYTGATSFGEVIRSPQQNSLGGFISGIRVPNGRKNSLFFDVSLKDLEKRPEQIIGLAIKNEGAEKTSLSIEINAESPKHEFKIGIEILGNSFEMEKLALSSDIPYNSDLEEIVLGTPKVYDLTTTPWAENTYIGLWIQRKLISNVNVREIEGDEQLTISIL